MLVCLKECFSKKQVQVTHFLLTAPTAPLYTASLYCAMFSKIVWLDCYCA